MTTFLLAALLVAVIAQTVLLWLTPRRNIRRAEDAAKNAAEAADIAVRAARSAQAVANKTYFDRQGSRR